MKILCLIVNNRNMLRWLPYDLVIFLNQVGYHEMDGNESMDLFSCFLPYLLNDIFVLYLLFDTIYKYEYI